MELYDALGLFQNQTVNVNRLWEYYSTATLAVLGFTIASEKATRSRHEITAIQIGYFVFAFGNAFAVKAAQAKLIKYGILVEECGGSEKLASTFSVVQISIFHALVTLSVLLIIEVTYRYNKSSKTDAEKSAVS